MFEIDILRKQLSAFEQECKALRAKLDEHDKAKKGKNS
jgi:prefoldin subunit 5